jgi:hypothetical protein
VFVETQKIKTEHTRQSKLRRSHTYCRYKTVALLRCDACFQLFTRDLGTTDRKRLSNQYRHVCGQCDQKNFAQTVGVENRRFWKISADADLDISKF